MMYETGEEVRYSRDGRFGIVREVDEENRIYKVEIDGEIIETTENELC